MLVGSLKVALAALALSSQRARRRTSGGLAVGDLKLRHQQQVEHAVGFVRMEDDDRPAGLRLSHEVWMRDIKGPPVCHTNLKRPEWLQVQCRSELLGGHARIIAGDIQAAKRPRSRRPTGRVGFAHHSKSAAGGQSPPYAPYFPSLPALESARGMRYLALKWPRPPWMEVFSPKVKWPSGRQQSETRRVGTGCQLWLLR
jgi:hypothetical protein